MQAFQQQLKTLEAADTQVLGVSMDSAYANKAFADQIGVTFPLLSDWGGKVTHEYGIYKDEYQAARRVNFLIGKDGKILEEQVDKDAIDEEDRGCLPAAEDEGVAARDELVCVLKEGSLRLGGAGILRFFTV